MSPTDWWIVNDPEDGRAKVRTLVKRGVDVIKLWDDNFTAEEFSAMIGEAHANNVKVAAHLLTTDRMRNALKSGLKERDTIHHVGAGRGARYPDDVVKMIVAQNVYLVATIVAFDGFRQIIEDPETLDDPIWKKSLPEKVYEDVRQSFLDIEPEKSSLYEFSFLRRQDRRAKLHQLYEAGAQFVLGTDSGSRANPHHSAAWREMVLMVDEIGMSNMEVIEAATRIAAEVLGQESTLGTIEVGKIGDVIVINGDPLAYMSDMRLVEHVIKNGVIHY
jgi:imidazolonepropionase-like amidohydrolase